MCSTFSTKEPPPTSERAVSWLLLRSVGSTWTDAPTSWWTSWVWWTGLRPAIAFFSFLPKKFFRLVCRKLRECLKQVSMPEPYWAQKVRFKGSVDTKA